MVYTKDIIYMVYSTTFSIKSKSMVYSEEKDPLTGQMFRDRVRCEAMESLGYYVKTMDDKHDGDIEREVAGVDFFREDKNFAKRGTHCRANFAQFGRMIKSFRQTWGDITFEQIILDYFFCPAGYVRVRWAEKFFSETLPAFAANNIISSTGSIWLPHTCYVEEQLGIHEESLSKYYSWELIDDYNRCPLYKATEMVEDELEMCPDRRTNTNQIEPLKSVSKYIFYELKRKLTLETPTKEKRQRSTQVTPKRKNKKIKKIYLAVEFENTTSSQ